MTIYNTSAIRFLKAFFLLGIAFLIAAALNGCYTQSKADRQLNHAKDKYPQETAKKMHEWFPVKTEIKTGKKDTASNNNDFYRKLYFQALASKQKTKDSIHLIYKDTCEMISDDSYDAGYEHGLIAGELKGKSECAISTHQTDTIYNSSSEQNVYIQTLVDSLAYYKKLAIQKTQEALDQKSDKKTYQWAFWISLFLFGLGIGLFIRFGTIK